MSDELAQPVDVVVFFDANMPTMDICSNNCHHKNKKPILCLHRFKFVANVMYFRGALKGLDDFEVLQYFFKYIKRKYTLQSAIKKPLFILITRDEDFLENDAPEAYRKALRAGKNEVNLVFSKNSVSDGKNTIFVLEITHKKNGDNRFKDLRSAIEKANKFWARISQESRIQTGVN